MAELPDLSREAGVSIALARHRAAAVSNVSYDLELTLPDDLRAPVAGRVIVAFNLSSPQNLVVDCAEPDRVHAVTIGGRAVEVAAANEHLVVPARALRSGRNEVEFRFTCDGRVLNRRDGWLSSLFVPARARYAFPCFDQPDLRARFSLTLEVPQEWDAVSNAPVDVEAAGSAGTRVVRFATTEPLPTYLLAFVAGRLKAESCLCAGEPMRVWHQEGDATLVGNNLDAIVALHEQALRWLVDYTGVSHPFPKLDIVLVPSFQFSGMEHPGLIYYDAGRLLLDGTATDQDRLTRASLIAHETAHLWFGDLVTMRWFDDVWLKEVFANLMAARIVAEVYPGHPHALQFFLANHPHAYAVDRSGGAHAIRQPLENLAEAGQLYGPIIYLKAPVVLRQLERRLGEEPFRAGVRRWLEAYRFGASTWDELVDCLAPGDVSFRALAESWIDEAGRPSVRVDRIESGGTFSGLSYRTSDPSGRGREWPQILRVALGHDHSVEHVGLAVERAVGQLPCEAPAPRYVLAGGEGLGYGHFPLDEASREWLVAHIARIRDPLTRAVGWAALWDDLLEGSIDATRWMDAVVASLEQESELQLAQFLLSLAERAWWVFLSTTEREVRAPSIEACMRGRLSRGASVPERSMWLAAVRQMAVSEDALGWLERVWRRELAVTGQALGESEETEIALELAAREWPSAADAVARQIGRIQDGDRRARLMFLAPFVSADPFERESAFAGLRDPRNRTREPWVVAGLRRLNHSSRQAHARRFIRPALDMLPEIARTGDIFLPSRWCDALLAGHASPAAAVIVDAYLAQSSGLAPRLRGIVLRSADLLVRSGCVRS